MPWKKSSNFIDQCNHLTFTMPVNCIMRPNREDILGVKEPSMFGVFMYYPFGIE